MELNASSPSLERHLPQGGSLPNAPLRLRFVPFAGDPFVWESLGPSAVLGRSSKCDVVLADRSCSRQHTRLYRDADAWMVEDLGSRNTTLLDGRAVTTPTRLADGDVLQIGETRVFVELPSSAAVATVPTAIAREWESAVFRPAAELMPDEPTGAVSGEEALRRYAERLKVLSEVHRALAGPISLDQLLELILDKAFALLHPEEGLVYLQRPDGSIERVAERRLPGTPVGTLSSRSLAAEVIDKKLAAVVLDTQTDERFSMADSILLAGVRCLVAAPLLHADGCPGMIVLTSRVRRRQFSDEDLEVLVSLGSVAGLRIRNIALAEDAARRLVLERELDTARQIQQSLLPESVPDVPGYALIAESHPSRTVSGDLYAVRESENGAVVVFVADVSGKGMAASLLTASLEALATGPIEVGLPADEMCERLSRRLYARTPPERFATAFVGALDPALGRIRYANAGHNPALLVRRSGAIEQLGASGPPLGLLPDSTYSLGEVVLEKGDTLVVYTDGITEAENASEEEYGIARLLDVCRRQSAGTIDELHRAIHEDLDRFVGRVPFADDRTHVILRRLGE